jgi:hypothetical protein
MTPGSSFISGLDLGQVNDFSALVILERITEVGASTPRYRLQKIKRFDLGTPYTEVCERVAKAYDSPPLAGSILAVDGTGVGRGVVDLLRKQNSKARLEPILITGGHGSSKGDDGYRRVPKKDLVGTMHVVLGSGRLEISRDLPEAGLLKRELLGFKVHVSKSANEIYENREGENDDLVLAVAMAVYVGEQPRLDYASFMSRLRAKDDDEGDTPLPRRPRPPLNSELRKIR